MKKTYIIHSDAYMYEMQSGFEKFEGTWRELLEHLNDVEGGPEGLCNPDAEEGESMLLDGVEIGYGVKNKDVPDSMLEKWFNDANGDGQPYVDVWCVEDEVHVLGKVEVK